MVAGIENVLAIGSAAREDRVFRIAVPGSPSQSVSTRGHNMRNFLTMAVCSVGLLTVAADECRACFFGLFHHHQQACYYGGCAPVSTYYAPSTTCCPTACCPTGGCATTSYYAPATGCCPSCCQPGCGTCHSCVGGCVGGNCTVGTAVTRPRTAGVTLRSSQGSVSVSRKVAASPSVPQASSWVSVQTVSHQRESSNSGWEPIR